MTTLAVIAGVLALLPACTAEAQPAPEYEPAHLRDLILTTPPGGTVVQREGPRTLDDLAADDDNRRQRLEGAGLIAAFERTFTAGSAGTAPDGFMLVARAYLFDDPDKGLHEIRELAKQRGSRLRDDGTPIDERPGFTFIGNLDDGAPPGIQAAWVKRNAVLTIIVVAFGEVDLDLVLRHARAIDLLEPPGFAQPEPSL